MSKRPCSVEGCERAYRNRGYCRKHLFEAFPEMAPKPCTEDGCDKPQQTRGLCSMHYSRVLRVEKDIADPEQNVAGIDPIKKITSRCEIGLCWEWTRACNDAGYGVVAYQGRNHYVHRLLWTLLVGEIPEGLEIDHLCKNTRCCNPDHLEPVAPRVNKLRSGGMSGRHAKRTHCAHGHEYTDTTLRIDRRGNRQCRACDRIRRDRRNETRRQARAAHRADKEAQQ